MSNLIKVTPVQSTISDNLIYVCDETKTPWVNLAQLLIMFPNVPRTTIQRRLKLSPLSEVKTSEIPTSNGFKLSPLYSHSVVSDLAFEFDLALAKLMSQAGAVVFLYGLAGYKVQVAEPEKPKTALELAKEQVKLLEALELLELQNKALLEETDRLAEAVDELFDYSSIIRIAKYNNCSEKAFSWRVLKSASEALNLEIKKVPCPRYETKNIYSHDAWRLAYPGYNLPETTTLIINP